MHLRHHWKEELKSKKATVIKVIKVKEVYEGIFFFLPLCGRKITTTGLVVGSLKDVLQAQLWKPRTMFLVYKIYFKVFLCKSGNSVHLITRVQANW